MKSGVVGGEGGKDIWAEDGRQGAEQGRSEQLSKQREQLQRGPWVEIEVRQGPLDEQKGSQWG